MWGFSTACVFTGVFVSWTIPSSKSASCTYRQTVGSFDTAAASVYSPDPVDKNVTVLMANTMGTVQCCGVVLAWDLYVEGKGFISLQVWRPVQGQINKYMLKGANGIRHRSSGISQAGRTISDRNSVHVSPGDILGFVQTEASILRYTTCNTASPTHPHICAEDILINTGVSDPAAGDVVEFVTKQSTVLGSSTVRGYAVKAYLDKKNPVSCADKRKTISDTLSVGDYITSVKAENMDHNHPESLFVIDGMSPSLPVAMDPHTGEITASGKLTPAYPSTDYILTVRVVDVCSSINTCNVTITVENVPKSITFISLPASVEVTELTEYREVYEFQISAQRDVDDVTCYITSTTLPRSFSYKIKNKSKTDYGIHLVKTTYTLKILDSETIVTVLLIACENTQGQYNQSTLTLTYRSEEKVFGVLLTIVGLVITFVVFAMVTVLLFWLCHKGKVKVWPSNDHVSKTGTVKNSKIDQADRVLENKGLRAGRNGRDGHSRTDHGWDNCSSFYKVGPRITSGRPIGELDNQIKKSHETVLVSKQQNGGRELQNGSREYSSSPNQVLQKKPWRP